MFIEEYWTTKDGKKIAVSEMEESHVRNVLRMLLRKRRDAEECGLFDEAGIEDSQSIW